MSALNATCLRMALGVGLCLVSTGGLYAEDAAPAAPPMSAEKPGDAGASEPTDALSVEDTGAVSKQAGPEVAPELLIYEEIPPVIGAARHEQRQDDAPSSVTVITAEEIALYGYNNLVDILRTQRSFYAFDDGEWSYVGVRGFLRPGEWNARILILIDGHPMREPIYGCNIDQGMLVPVENIQRIEIIRGPGSALYGGGAVFAVINIITRSGGDVNGGELKGQFGNKNTARGVATFGKSFGKDLDLMFSVARFTTQGTQDLHFPHVHDPALSYGDLRNSDYEGAGSMFFKGRANELTLELSYNRRKTDNSSVLWGAVWQNPGRALEQRFDMNLAWDHEIDARQSLHAMAYYGRYRYHEIVNTDNQDGLGPYAYHSTAQAEWTGADLHYDLQPCDEHHLVLGAEFSHPCDVRQKEYDDLWGVAINSRSTGGWGWWSLYAQDEYTPLSWLQITGGIRADYWNQFGTLVSPRGAVIFHPTRDDTVKLLYGRAFRTPNIYELFYSVPGSQALSQNLEPEVNDTYEVVWGHEWKDGWRTEATYYFWRMSDSIIDGTDPITGLPQVQNNGTLKAHGVEGEVQKRWKNGARLRVSGSLGHAVDDNGDRLIHSPDAILNVAGAVPVVNDRTFLSLETQILGAIKSDTGGRADPSYITNLVLTSKDVVKGLDLHVGVYNLFGELAEIPRSGPTTHTQLWLRHEGMVFLAGFTFRF